MRSISIIELALLLMLCQPVLAQTNDCLIYEKVLTIINIRQGKIKYTYTLPPGETMDPTNPVLITERVQGKLAWNFLLVNSIYHFSPRAIEQWFSRTINDTSLIHMEFIRGEGDTTINCHFDRSIKYQFCDFFPTEDMWTSITEIKGADTIHYSPLRLRFSNVLYSKEGFAVVSVQYTARDTRGRFEWLHCFVFQLINNEWDLIKEGTEVL